MKIIYHCYGGAHSSVTAAAVHLGWLPTDRIPGSDEIKAIPYFDRPVTGDHGRLQFMGNDEFGNDIYVIGRRNAARVFENMAIGMAQVYGFCSEQLVLVNVMPYVNWKMVVGGFTSRKLGFTAIGRPVVTAGVKAAYWKIVSIVNRIKVCTASGNTVGLKRAN
ncbi:DUF3189 family protein [Phosphitispora fastidiosa]|uniref:DUF3189 family protein n=1 Tax=Phosphitispora fastidiosa TaxID=2837202 RepID=UPI001E522D43|nr:DUF3189 family protein [Phosphitispora fastidiosa]MBU7005547.1 hypothetical protein [Phosphitispora fastidiosa]